MKIRGMGSMALFLVMILPAAASAQKAGGAKNGAAKAGASGDKSADGQDVEMGLDPLPSVGDPSAPAGSAENPNAPHTEFTAAPVEAHAQAQPASPQPYPIEQVERPLTLPRHMVEVTLTTPNTFNPYVQSEVLGAHAGYDDRLELGLRYGLGTLADGSYYGGKAFAIDGQYQIFHFLAAQMSIPMLVDPFSFGVTLGAPLKFTLFHKLALLFGRDLLTFRIDRFAPSIDNAAQNQAYADLDATNTALPAGDVTLNFDAIWQQKPNLALSAHLGIRLTINSTSDVSGTGSTDRDALPFDVGLTYSTSNKVDIGGRIGFADVNNADKSFGLSLLAALRI